MDKAVLYKYKNDPAWAETIKLCSGLFDSGNDREQFIVNLAESDVLLASECKNSSTVEESSISDSRLASIYIGELANERVENIFSFKYNGVTLHKGQVIFAKVKNIDNQNRVNLSLKGLSK
jgi:hypothetical protein